MLLNQTSDDTFQKEKELALNLNDIKAEKGGFFGGSGSIEIKEVDRKSRLKSKKQQEAD